MEEGKREMVNPILKQYKNEFGAINYPKLFDIPKSERIAELAVKDFSRIVTLVSAAVTMALESINLKKPMNAIQILDLSEAIIDSANEDNLSFEDLMLFLQGLVRGKYPVSDTMDLPRFMKSLDVYRDERWQEAVKIRDEKISQWQSLGDAGRSAKRDPLSEHMSKISGRIEEMKEALSEKKQSETMKKADKFFKE